MSQELVVGLVADTQPLVEAVQRGIGGRWRRRWRWRRRRTVTVTVATAILAPRAQFVHHEVHHFIQTLAARGAHGQNMPRVWNSAHDARQVERGADLGARHGIG